MKLNNIALSLLLSVFTHVASAETYVYQVIDKSNGLATKAQVTAVAGSTPSLPLVIQNKLVSTYYYWAAADITVDGSTYTVNGGATPLTSLPAGDQTIYVTYDYDNSTSPIDLSGAKVYYVKDGNPGDAQDCHYLSLQYGSGWVSPSWVIEDEIDIDSKRQWRFEGDDPYKMYFRNVYAETYSSLYTNAATAGPYMRSDLAVGGFGDSDNVRFGPKDTDKLFNTYFIDTEGHIVAANNTWNLYDSTNRYIYLAKQNKTTYQTTGSRFYITGSGKIDFNYMHYSISQRPTNVNYTILTKQNKVFMAVEGDAATELHLPTLVQSPLVSAYHFWPATAYTDSNSDGVYEKNDAVSELDAATYTATEGETIYVTYDYDPDNAVEFGSNTVNVDLTGKTRYTINTGSEATKRYITWRYDAKRTLVTTNDSYYTSRNNTSEPATWNDYWFWTFSYEGTEPDPYAIVIKSGVPTQYPIVGGENHVLSVYQGTGTDNTNTDIWSIPEDADGSSYVKTWALLTDNKLVCRKPGTTTKVNRFNADGSTRPNNFDEMGTNGAVLLGCNTIGYHVVNRSGQIAVATRIARVTTGNLAVPADLKSAHIIDDGDHYRYFPTQAGAAAYSASPSDEVAIENNFIRTYDELAALGSTEVYVGYRYDPANIPAGVPEIGLQASTTSLSGIARYHVQINNKYWKSTDVNWHDRPNFGDGGNELVSANYQWLFVSGNTTLPDPYDIRIKNPYYPDGYLHDQIDNVESGGTNGAYSTGHGMFLCRTSRHDHDDIHSFFFTQSDIGIVVSVATLPNKQGRQSYLYNHNNSYALLQRGTRGGDVRQKFEISPLRLFRVVNKAGNIAVSAYMPATSPLTVPTGLRTPLMTESQYRFFTTQAKAAAYNANPTDAEAATQGAITTAPATGEIFIGYNYMNNPEVMDLSGTRWYNIKGILAPNTTATSYYYCQNNGNTSWNNFVSTEEKADEVKYMFQFTGNDPYDITIYNGQEWNSTKQALARENRNDWYYALIQKRNYSDASNPVLSFMMLEHEDGYATLAVHNKWYVNGSFNLGTAGDDAYIGMKFYMHYWSLFGNLLCMTNNDSYFTYYSDRNRYNNYATKLVFEPVQHMTTIHIIDTQGREAIKYKGLMDANMPIDFVHIPAAIRSPFLIDETITGYSTATSNGTASDGRTIWNLSDVITQTPATAATDLDVYIKYTTDHVFEKPFRLTGQRAFNVRINGDNYIYTTGTGNAGLAATTSDADKATSEYYWHLLGDGADYGAEQGGDPYAFRLWNNGAGSSKYLKYNTSTGALSVDGNDGEAGTYFIAMRNNAGNYYEVMAATGGDAATNYYNIGYDGTSVKIFDKSEYPQGNAVLQIFLSTNELRTTYYIIDKAKKIVAYATEDALDMEVPASIKSPLVSHYHFWKLADFTVDNGSGGSTADDALTTTYTQRNDTYTRTGTTELVTITEAPKDANSIYQIYVTYDKEGDVNDRVQFNGRNKGGEGKMYMLRFNNGSSFYQEDGRDGINRYHQADNALVKSDVPLKAVYPYSNGDANLYIYGEQMWATQSGTAATTRGRWQWFVESANDDPYHVKIASRQSQNSNYNYFRTYKPQDYAEIVTGVITESDTEAANYVGKQQTGESDEDFAARVARQEPTEYMVVGTDGAFKLKTVELISDGATNEQRTVTSFEQYWKTYDTAKKKVLGNTDPDKDTDPATVTNSSDRDKLTSSPYNWHAYKAWANAKRWNGYNGVTNDKKKGYEYLEHWFQTIDMGDGSFDFIETELNGALVLVDSHGWEIMRKPMPTGPADPDRAAKYAAIKPYDSPMVKAYHFYKTSSKIPGYHKFNLSNPCMVGDDEFTSTSLTVLPPKELAVDENGNSIDWYVTYEVKEQYATSYTGATTEAECVASDFLVHQGSSYAMMSGSSATTVSITTVPDDAIANNNASLIEDNMKWKLKPNFNIDAEMGYKYPGETAAQPDAQTFADMQANYVSTNKPGCNNGFDPYNLQIVNTEHGGYFTTDATSAIMNGHGGWRSTYPGTTGQLGLQTAVSMKYHATGDDNALLDITNTTFMAVDDGNGNIRLMPRFDHDNVVTNFSTIETQMAVAPIGDNNGPQTTLFTLPVSYEYIIVDNSGHESVRYRGSIGDVSPYIPAYMASPLAKDFKFYKNLTLESDIYTEVEAGTDISEKEITGTFGEAGLTATNNTVYVRYSFNPEGDKYKILSEGDWHTISVNGKPMWVDYDHEDAQGNPLIPIANVLPATPGYEWQCKFIYNPDSEIPDPYNASTFNRVLPNKRWDIHYAILPHGDEVAYLLARQGNYNYTFLSAGASGNGEGDDHLITFYQEPYFDGTTPKIETVFDLDENGEKISDGAGGYKTHEETTKYPGNFNNAVSQITFGDVPEETVTYYVITNSGHLALTAKEPSARAKGEPTKPTAVLPQWARSPLLNTEDFTYYMQATDNGDGTYTVNDVDRTTRMIGLPENKIYVRYNYSLETTPYRVKDTYFTSEVAPRYVPLDLTGNTWYNIVTYSWGDDWLYTVDTGSEPEKHRVRGLDRPAQYQQFTTYPKKNGNFLFQSTAPYLWKLTGGDPYEFKMVNLQKGNDRYFSGKFSDTYPEGTGQIPYMLQESDNADITTFMLLKPMSSSNDIRIVATGRLNYYLSNTRWGANWISYYDAIDETKENPFQGVGYHGYEFFKAPVVRNYTFHAMNCDGEGDPVNTWTMTLQRDWLTQVKLEDDITRICAEYEKAGEHIFVDRDEAGNGRFYNAATMRDEDRVYDSNMGEYDIYPQIDEDATYHIYFRYKTKPEELAQYTSTEEEIASDVAYHKANGRLDQEMHPGDAKWWFMVLDTDEDITATGSGDSRTFTGSQMFLRRSDDGNVGWMKNDYALHKEDQDNYNNWNYNRLAEWYKDGDNDAFREGRWLWTFVGTDPYLMKIVNLESAVGVTPESEGVYSLDAADNCYVTIKEVERDNGSMAYPVKIPTEEPTENLLWGMTPGYGSENTFSLMASITNDSHQALFWSMNNGVLNTDSVTGNARVSTRSQAIKLLRYEPVRYEDVMLVIRRNDEVAEYQSATAAKKPEILANMKTGISKLYFAASERTFAAGDKIDMSNEETLPLNVRRAFCNYTLYKDIFTTVGGTYEVKAGPYPTTTQASTTGSWSGTGVVGDPYVYNQTGDLLFDDDGKPVWTYTTLPHGEGVPADGAQSIYASYEVTTDIFLKEAPTKAQVAAMAQNNDHVYFMDFPDKGKGTHHAFYDQEATSRIQTEDLEKKKDLNTGIWVPEKRKWNGTDAFVDDFTKPYNELHYRSSTSRMASVPDNLKWYFVGDPYKVQVYNVAGAWNETPVTDLNGKVWAANTKAANLARFNTVETNFQFIVDCVHLQLPDYTAIDHRSQLYPTDELGNALDPIPNRNVSKPYLNDFYWECVPAASDEEGTFALRFKEDNDLLGYRNVYYYLAHDGLTKKYLTTRERDHVVYHINLNYRPDNMRQTKGDFKGYHIANNDTSIIRLVQPVKLYVNAFSIKNNTGASSQWTPNPDTGGFAASTGTYQRMTHDELSEYYGLGETITEVPLHLQRKYVKYGTINYQLTESRAYNAPLSECSTHASNVFVTGTKINPVFKLNVSYRLDDLSTTTSGNTEHLFTSNANYAAGNIQWLDVMVDGDSWLYYDKTNTDGGSPAVENETNRLSNYRRAMSENKDGWNGQVSGWDDGLKGLHWAFIGDPYDFTILNRRRYEDAPSGNCWLIGTRSTIADFKGTVPNDSVVWAMSLASSVPDVNTAAATAALTDGQTVGHWALQMWKMPTYDNSSKNIAYFLRTASRKDTAYDPEHPEYDAQTNSYWRLMAKRNNTMEFYSEPYSLSDRSRYTNDMEVLNYENFVNKDMGFSKTMSGLGEYEQRLTIRTAVAKDEDNADNDCFDTDVRIYSSSHQLRIDREGMEIKYGVAADVLPYSMRRFGCTYDCYLVVGTDSMLIEDFDDAAAKLTGITGHNERTFRQFITYAKENSTAFHLSYIYHVEEATSQFFTTASDALTDDYTWMNTYFAWDQYYSGTNMEVEYYDDVFDHYVYNSAGQIIDEVWIKVRKTRPNTNPEEAYPTTAFLNSHTAQEKIYADESTQSESDRQKWSLVGDPYEFTMKNYAQYLENPNATIKINGTNVEATNITSQAQKFAIAIDKKGNPYLTVIGSDGEADSFVSFTFNTSSEKNLQTTGSGANDNDPTGNTLSTGGAKPFKLDNLIRYADILQYHLVIAHQHSLDPTETYLQNLSDADATVVDGLPVDTDTKNLYKANRVTLRNHLLEYLKYQSIRSNNPTLYVNSDASAWQTEKVNDIKTLLKQNASLRDFISYPIEDYSVSRVGIGNHPQVPWYMKRQFCRYYIYQKDVQRSVVDYSSPAWEIADDDYIAAGGTYVTEDGVNYKTDSHGDKIQRTFEENGETKKAYNVAWKSLFDKSTWSEWTSDEGTEGTDYEKINGVKRKIPSGYTEALALQGKVLDKLQECHFNRKVLLDVVYEVIPEEFRFAYRRRNTTAWYQMTTNNAADGLMNFSYKDGIGARTDRATHFTNNYLWAPEGDPYGFVLRSRYATINGNGWDNVAITTKGHLPKESDHTTYSESTILAADADAYLAKYTSQMQFNDKRIIHKLNGEEGATSDGPSNAVYEMFTGDAGYTSSFLMHPTSAFLDNDDSDFESYYMIHDTETNKTKLTKASGRTLQTNADANWRLSVNASMLWPYFERAGYVGGLDPVKATFINQDYYNQLKTAVTGGTEPTFSTLRQIQEVVFSGTFKDNTGATVDEGADRPAASLLPMTFQATNLVNMADGYYRIQGFSTDKLNAAETTAGIQGPRYISGYRFKSEIAGTKPLHFFETDQEHAQIHTFADLNTKKGFSDGILRGNIELLPADYDASSIFRFQGSTTNGVERYTLATQGLNVQAVTGSTSMSTAAGTQFRLEDIGGATVTLRTLSTGPTTSAWDTDVVNTLKTNYLNSNGDSYSLTLTADNEMNQTDGTDIQDTKWRLQPVGIHEPWPYNEMPLRVEVNKGGVKNCRITEPELSAAANEDKNYYGSLYVPFDTRLGNTTDVAFTLTGTVTDGTLSDPGSVTMASVSQLNEMGNPQFVPANWPVVIRTSNASTSITLKNKPVGDADPTTYATRHYVNMYIPNPEPTVISDALTSIKLEGQYLEQTITTDKHVMVFGLPFQGTASGHTSHEYDLLKQIGFFTNDNWARESNPGYKAHTGSYAAAGTDGSVAEDGQRSNKYVYHNKIYYLHTIPADPGARYAVMIFDGEDQPEEPDIEDGLTKREPWPCNVYDLQGRRVASNETPQTLRRNHPSLQPGVYIFGGKKVVVR